MTRRFPDFDHFHFWSAYLTLRCNHSCPYCIQGYGLPSRAKLPVFEERGADEWIAGLNAIEPKPFKIVLQGGEPTLHPGCFEIIEGLRGFEEIHLYTNLFFDPAELAAKVKVNLPRLRIYASFHPPCEKDLKAYAERLRALMNLGQPNLVVRNALVRSPQNLPRFNEHVAAFAELGLSTDSLDFQGVVDGKLVPEGYEEGFGLHSRKKVWCRCRQVNIAPNGELYNCATRVYRKDKASYGNLFSSEPLRFPAGFVPCDDYGFCNPCTITRTQVFPQHITINEEKKSMFGVAIIGCGYMANWHVNGWSSIAEAKILAVVDLDTDRAKLISDKANGAEILTDYRALFDRKDIKAVSVTLPHHVRAEVVCDLLEHGIHVLLEKPAALSLAEAAKMQKSADAGNATLMIAENWRYNPVTIEARKLIQAGAIGTPFMTYAHMEFMENFRPHQMLWHADPVKAGGGVIIDSGVHVLSVLRMLMGEVTEVFAMRGKQVWKELEPCEDSGAMLFRFATGATGSASLAWRGKRKNFHSPFTVLGDEGILEFNFQGGINPEHVITLTKGQDVEEIVVPSSPSMGIQEQTRHFVDCMTAGREPETCLREEIKSVQLALVAYESIKSGGWTAVPALPF